MIPWISDCEIWSQEAINIPVSYGVKHIFILEASRRWPRVWQTLGRTDFTIANAALHHTLCGQIQRVQFVLVHSVAGVHAVLPRVLRQRYTANSHGAAITPLQWVSGSFLDFSITTGISGTSSFYGDVGRKSMHRARDVATLSVDRSRVSGCQRRLTPLSLMMLITERLASQPASPPRYGTTAHSVQHYSTLDGVTGSRARSRADNSSTSVWQTRVGRGCSLGVITPPQTHRVCNKSVAETSSFTLRIFQLYS